MLPTNRQFSRTARLPCSRSNAGAGDLRAVVAEDAVAEDGRVLDLVEMLDRDPAAAGAGVVAVDLDVLDRRIRPRVDLDAAAVRVEERRLPHIVRLDRRALAGAGREVVGPGDPEAAQHGLAADAVPEIDDMVDDRRMAGGGRIGDVGVGGGEDDVAARFERDAVVPGVEPDQRLPLGRRTVGAGLHAHDLVHRIARGGLERILDAAGRMHVIGLCGRVEGEAVRRGGRHRRALLCDGARRQHAACEQQPDECTSIVLPKGHGSIANVARSPDRQTASKPGGDVPRAPV